MQAAKYDLVRRCKDFSTNVRVAVIHCSTLELFAVDNNISRSSLSIRQKIELTSSSSLPNAMTPREAKFVQLALFHTFLIAICAANGNQTCRSSSCGEIRNISYPFRLQTDPSGCGEPDFELVCENNRTVADLGNGKYYVTEIFYDNYTIRVVDPGIVKGNCFSTPLHSLTYDTDSSSYSLIRKEARNVLVLMNCDQPISDGKYIPIVPCNSSNLTSSSSQPYVYALVGELYMPVEDINYSCTIRSTSLTQFLKPSNLSMSDLQEVMLLGVDFSFVNFRCKIECTVKGLQCIFYENNIECWTGYNKNWLQTVLRGTFDLRAFKISRLRDFYNQGADGTAIELGWVIRWIIMVVIGRNLLGMLCMCAFLIYKFQRRHLSMDDSIEKFLQSHKNLQPIRYSYSEIKKMTHNFKDKLGQGGFGSVYKGKIRSGQIVAVKMLISSKSNGQDFINEVATIGRIHHVNVVQLVGFCMEKSKWALVYDFMANGSLDKYVFLERENSIPLSWERLYNISLGVARGIEYLHRGCQMQILHFDIKPHNILLDDNFTPKVSDFGLAKLYSSDKNAVTITAARGTLGYIAPELFYKNIGDVSYKADVYSFGMLLMEMMGRSKYMNAHSKEGEIHFPSWIYDRIDRGEDMEMGYTTEEDYKYIRKIIIVALWCVQMKPTDRPSMSKALEMLEGEEELLQMPPKPTLNFLESSMDSQMNNRIEGSVSLCNGTMTTTLEGR